MDGAGVPLTGAGGGCGVAFWGVWFVGDGGGGACLKVSLLLLVSVSAGMWKALMRLC